MLIEIGNMEGFDTYTPDVNGIFDKLTASEDPKVAARRGSQSCSTEKTEFII